MKRPLNALAALTVAFLAFPTSYANAQEVVVVIENMPDNCQRENDGTITCDGYTVDEFCRLFGSSSESFCYGGSNGSGSSGSGSSGSGSGSGSGNGYRAVVKNKALVAPGIRFTTGDTADVPTGGITLLAAIARMLGRSWPQRAAAGLRLRRSDHRVQ